LKNKNVLNSFYYAFQGINIVWKERNFKLHILSAILAISMAYILKISNIEWCIVLLCIGIVLMAEVFNTTIEKIVDMVSPEHNPKAGIIKDLAAAAVLIISIVAAVIAVIIFTPYFLK